jgi:hypothetical protein
MKCCASQGLDCHQVLRFTSTAIKYCASQVLQLSTGFHETRSLKSSWCACCQVGIDVGHDMHTHELYTETGCTNVAFLAADLLEHGGNVFPMLQAKVVDARNNPRITRLLLQPLRKYGAFYSQVMMQGPARCMMQGSAR